MGIHGSSAISASLFAELGPFAVSSLRMVIAAFIVLVLFRPRWKGRSAAQWRAIVLYGVAMAAMNMSLYVAIERIPLGIAVTLDFLGPCTVALLASRHVREACCALVALAGVALISLGPGGYVDVVGYLAGLSAAFFFGLYALSASRVGKSESGLGDMALSVVVAAVLTVPLSVPHFATLQGRQWGLLAVSAALGVVLTFSMDTIAGRLTSARVIGTLFAVDPAVGVVVGWVFLGEALTWTAIAGIVIVSVAGALLVWTSGRGEPAGISSTNASVAAGGDHLARSSALAGAAPRARGDRAGRPEPADSSGGGISDLGHGPGRH